MANVEKIIRKGLSNKKDYLLHKLKNGMKCLLISQPDNECKTTTDIKPDINRLSVTSTDENDHSSTDESYSSDEEEIQKESDSFAMSLCVHNGSFSDPVEAQGLAHLLEHMVSMGSKRYPADNHFDRFLYRKAGYSNAETGCEYTNYHFEVPMEYSQEASDIFASMFQAPKLAKESIDKEKQVVDSEFQMAISDDDSRIQRLISICADKENPAGQFFWGNLDSLNHENLSEMVVDFWKNHYSASRMTLAVQSKQSTHEMVEWIDNLFSEVPTDNQPPPVFKISQDPFCPDLFHKMFKIVSVSSTKSIIFTWYLPPIIELYKIKPLEYIAWIVGHEGKGTLINYLRKLNYAMELEAGVEDDFYSNSIYSLFTITIELTDLGLKNVNEIIELTFSYLNLIKEKGISEKIFNQIQILAENDFNFAENKTAINHVKELSQNMLWYDEEDYICGPALLYEYSPETIAKFLSLLTVDRVAIFILAKEFDNSDVFIKDPTFGTKYLAESFTEELESKLSTITPHPFFQIHSDNQYLTKNFSILSLSTDRKYPEKIFENDHIELWFKQDTHFKLPKSYIMFYFITHLPSKSLNNYMCMDLFFDSIVFLLNEETYPATMAQLNYSIRVFITGFELAFNGFNEKLPLLIDIVINCLNNYASLMTEEIFTMIKSKAINRLKNNQYDLDYVPSDLKNSLIQDPDWYLDKRLKYLETMEYKQILTFYEQLNTLYCRSLIQGNINQTQAIEVSKKVVSMLKYQPLAKECFPTVLIKRLNQGDFRVKMANYNPKDNNSMAYKYYQFDKNDINDSVKYHVLQSMMEESAFDELRTKQCLGYDVQLNVTATYHHYGFYFKVAHQKNKFETQYVFNRMDEFLKQFWENFNDPDEVNKVKDALIALKASPDDCLGQEFSRNINEILEGRFKFNRLELEIEALKNLTYDDVKNLKQGFLNGRAFSVEIIGNCNTDNLSDESPPIKKMCLEENENFIYIENVEEFKTTLKPF